MSAVLRQRSHAIGFERISIYHGYAVGLAYLVGYVLLDWVSFIHPFAPFGITPWNPGTGLSFVVVLLFGRRMIPYLFLAPLLSGRLILQTPLPWSVELLATTLIGGCYAGATLFLLGRTAHFDPALSSLRDLTLLILVAAVSAGVVAASYVGVMIGAGLLPGSDLATAALRYWVGDLIGIVVITPFALIILMRWRMVRVSLETALDTAAIIAALALVFGFAQERQVQLFYLLFLPIIWMAVRTRFEGLCVGVLITQLGIVVGVALSPGEWPDLMPFQVLMLTLAVTGLVVGVLVTERRNTESQLRRHQESLEQRAQLGNLGELAIAVAHEINQPLAAAGTYTRLVSATLRDGGADPTMITDTADKAVAQVERATEVIRRLRALVRLDRSGRAPCSVEQIVRETIALSRPALDHDHIVVHWKTAAKLPRVMVDMLQIEQTLLNLIKNSIEAIAGAKRRDGVIDIQAVLHRGAMVEIQVADNGPGFPLDSEDPFLPFVSQKREGLGIGLRLCRSIVEAHGGRLWLNHDARGAEVRFTLPIAKET